ncbi:MAG: hypothetical protein OQJ89_06775 [Kangiellaceae bacterium]|nr:hypothetical protein [Kangiellaceae bacterium]MCW9000368.1 hypothetical protein [Kangiellaceae bacterium]MCW9016647.1 hypothetical protein [Kangiellaceae bacterium]
MLEFNKSEFADSIYYADLFRIEGKVWMIMGYGKSEAARLASEDDRACDLSRDCVALKVSDNELYGRYDPGALGAYNDEDSELHKFHKIDFISYCLSPEQTNEVFVSTARKIIDCDPGLMSKLCVIYPYPAYAAQFAFSPEEIEELADSERRSNTFLKLITASNFKNLVLVPFMSKLESKAELYKNYVSAFA